MRLNVCVYRFSGIFGYSGYGCDMFVCMCVCVRVQFYVVAFIFVCVCWCKRHQNIALYTVQSNQMEIHTGLVESVFVFFSFVKGTVTVRLLQKLATNYKQPKLCVR